MPDSLISIEKNAFTYCRHLTEIILPDSVTSIGTSAFARCYNLSHIVLGNSIISIGEQAFLACDYNKIQLPKSISVIENQALGYTCPKTVTRITVNGVRKCDDFTLSGYCGTAAETYATENGFAFERIHDPIDIVVTPPTCTEPGVSGGTKCAGCGEVLSAGGTVIPPTGHTPGTQWSQDASNHWHICETCNELLDVAVLWRPPVIKSFSLLLHNSFCHCDEL